MVKLTPAAYKVILFDLWNTLAFWENVEAATQELRRQIGPEKFARLSAFFTEWHRRNFSLEVFLARLQNLISLNKDELLRIKSWLTYEKCKLYPETEEVLRFLKNKDKKLILITNSPPPARRSYRKLGLAEYFNKAIFSFEVGLMKPDPRIFNLAINGLDVKKPEVLMVGDSWEKDIVGALEAGIGAVLLDRDGESNYGCKIRALSDLCGQS